MNISPNEIESIEEAGLMNGHAVKLLRTKGGFWIATGRNMGKNQDEALAAGSHPAIVKYNLEKQYPGFRPMMMKSEASLNPTIVTKHNSYLSEELKKSGHDIYSVQSGSSIEFQLTKQNVKIGSVQTVIQDNGIVVQELNIPKEFSHALAGAVMEKGISCGAERIGIKGK